MRHKGVHSRKKARVVAIVKRESDDEVRREAVLAEQQRLIEERWKVDKELGGARIDGELARRMRRSLGDRILRLLGHSLSLLFRCRHTKGQKHTEKDDFLPFNTQSHTERKLNEQTR